MLGRARCGRPTRSSGGSSASTPRPTASPPGSRSRGTNPLGIAYGAGSIWVANRYSGSVTRVNARTNKAAKKAIKVGFGPYAIAYGAGSIWVSNESSGSVSRINPARNRVTKTIKVGGGPNGLVVAFGSLWVADYRLGRVLRIDPATNKITAKLPLAHADWITPTADALWISSETNSVYRLDPRTLQITASVAVGQNPLASTLLGDALGAEHRLEYRVRRRYDHGSGDRDDPCRPGPARGRPGSGRPVGHVGGGRRRLATSSHSRSTLGSRNAIDSSGSAGSPATSK